MPADWQTAVGPAIHAWSAVDRFVTERRSSGFTVLPEADRVFAALWATPFADVRAVILGQDPYPNPTHATGLAFSVPRDLAPPLPRSLVRIHEELWADQRIPIPRHGSLQRWTENGVLLLNTAMTVQVEEPRSHAGARWWTLTNAIIQAVASRPDPVAFLLWGRHAQGKARLIDGERHAVVCSPHPSPLARGFIGSRPFSRAESRLRQRGAETIDWSLD
jgi:uracil-DNA glycosylase